MEGANEEHEKIDINFGVVPDAYAKGNIDEDDIDGQDEEARRKREEEEEEAFLAYKKKREEERRASELLMGTSTSKDGAEKREQRDSYYQDNEYDEEDDEEMSEEFSGDDDDERYMRRNRTGLYGSSSPPRTREGAFEAVEDQPWMSTRQHVSIFERMRQAAAKIPPKAFLQRSDAAGHHWQPRPPAVFFASYLEELTALK